MQAKTLVLEKVFENLTQKRFREAASLLFHENYPWLYDGSLKGQILSGIDISSYAPSKIDFSGVDLSDSNCRETDFGWSIFRNTLFIRTELEGSMFSDCDLTSSIFAGANLRFSHLSLCTLTSTSFEHANLYGSIIWCNTTNTSFVDCDLEFSKINGRICEGAVFAGANLKGATFTNCTFDESVILPDGTHWSPDVDWSVFGAKTEIWNPDN